MAEDSLSAGRTALALGAWDEARAHFENAVAKDPNAGGLGRPRLDRLVAG